jgi:hypothetical protein
MRESGLFDSTEAERPGKPSIHYTLGRRASDMHRCNLIWMDGRNRYAMRRSIGKN